MTGEVLVTHVYVKTLSVVEVGGAESTQLEGRGKSQEGGRVILFKYVNDAQGVRR